MSTDHYPRAKLESRNLTTQGFDFNVTWEPFVDGHVVGYKVTREEDGAFTFVYMNPSSSGDDGEPDVFIYNGPNADPEQDYPKCFINPGMWMRKD